MTSARQQLADVIAVDAPPTWTIHAAPERLRSFTDPAKPVAVVIEQRGLASSRFSPDGEKIPVDVTLVLWVVVDGSRGDSSAETEDRLEDAAEDMIRLLEPLTDQVWDGTAERTAYDEQKPAYQFTLQVAGHIITNTQEG